jgi:hypothetical protein
MAIDSVKNKPDLPKLQKITAVYRKLDSKACLIISLTYYYSLSHRN